MTRGDLDRLRLETARRTRDAARRHRTRDPDSGSPGRVGTVRRRTLGRPPLQPAFRRGQRRSLGQGPRNPPSLTNSPGSVEGCGGGGGGGTGGGADCGSLGTSEPFPRTQGRRSAWGQLTGPARGAGSRLGGAASGRIDGSGADSCSGCCLPHTVLGRRGGIKLRHERQRSQIPAPGLRPVRRHQLHLSPGTAAQGSGAVTLCRQ